MEKPKLSVEEFVIRAIEALTPVPPRSGFKSKGRVIHTVFSGFNSAFREYFDGADPVAAINKLVKAGKISRRIVRKGAVIAMPGVLTDNSQALNPAEPALKTMGLVWRKKKA